MNLFSAAVVLAATIHAPRYTLGDDALVARFEAECQSATAHAECVWLRRELEVRLFRDLGELQKLGGPIDRDVARIAAEAEFPFLAVLGLQLMQQVEGPEDEATVIWALDHPSSGVRSQALELARRSDRPRLEALVAWTSGASVAASSLDLVNNDDGAAALLGEPLRWLDELGMPAFPATFRPSMSDGQKIVFTTSEPPQKVVAALAEGRETMNTWEFQAQLSVAMGEVDTSEIERISQEMEGVTDPQQMAELGQRLAAAMSKMAQPMAPMALARDPEATYFELPGDGGRTRWVAIGRDAELDLTTISVTP